MTWKLKNFDELLSNELYQILQLRCQVFVVEQQCPYLDIDQLDASAHHLFFEEDGQIIAYCRLLNPGVTFEEASIGRVLVHQDYRKKGLAKQMMLRAIDYLFEQEEQPSIKLSGQTYLRDFYQGLGFDAVDLPYLEDNIEHVDMVLKNPEYYAGE